MNSYQAVFEYLQDEKIENIFKRGFVYHLWAEKTAKKIHNRTFITLLSALAGPFSKDRWNEEKIQELLEVTDYGNASDWGKQVDSWAKKYCQSDLEWLYFLQSASLISNVQDEIETNFEQELSKQKEFSYYLPELYNKVRTDDDWPIV